MKQMKRHSKASPHGRTQEQGRGIWELLLFATFFVLVFTIAARAERTERGWGMESQSASRSPLHTLVR